MDLGGPRFGQRPSGFVSTPVKSLRNGFVLERAFEVKKEIRIRNVPLCEVPTIAVWSKRERRTVSPPHSFCFTMTFHYLFPQLTIALRR